MSYVDGYLTAVPTDARERYRAFAAAVAELFREYGAEQVVECWGDDVPEGATNSMRSAVLLEPGETVVFSWVRWPSRAIRDTAHEKIFADPRAEALGAPPLDGKRMIFGGFEPLVDL